MAEGSLAAVASSVLFERCLAAVELADRGDIDGEYLASMMELHRRGSAEELAYALELLRCEPWAQVVGCDVLGQLGYPSWVATRRCPHRDASVPAIRPLFSAPEEHVRSAAVEAVRFLGLGGVLADVVALASDASEQVRFSVAVALGGHEEDESIEALIALSADMDEDVRNWATFGLGSLGERDDELVRDTLAARLEDPHRETRGEALLGLALRGDPRGKGPLVQRLVNDDALVLELEAAEAYADPGLLPHLLRLRAAVGPADARHWVERLDRAIEACGG